MSHAIRIEGLGKRYAINRGGGGTHSIRDAVGSLFRLHFSSAQTAQVELAPANRLAQEFWALRDVTFDVAQGERVGIIGANGAGKSTLLKMLSRVTAPTEGRIEINGKVASLLEVGTGFHPELTGRENVYLNGAILGMRHAEIRKKFEQIVEFSGVEKFLDTPVKHYSSGMYVRLAFSVSAWLDPDILIVDEVLAVGDQAFQRKCAERMKDLTAEGRTVLFVSHSMATVNQMCQKALYLDAGRVVAYKAVEAATADYQRHVTEADEQGPWHRANYLPETQEVRLETNATTSVKLISGHVLSELGGSTVRPNLHQPFRIRLVFMLCTDLAFDIVPGFHFFTEMGERIFLSVPDVLPARVSGVHTADCWVPAFVLNTGRYTVGLAVCTYQPYQIVHFDAQHALRFEIVESHNSDPRRHGRTNAIPGVSRLTLNWSLTVDTLNNESVARAGMRAHGLADANYTSSGD